MSIWTAKTDLLGRRQCKRCHKMFLPRKEGQEYGPKCARKVAGQTDLTALDHVDRTDSEGEPGTRISAEESAVAAYRGAVLA